MDRKSQGTERAILGINEGTNRVRDGRHASIDWVSFWRKYQTNQRFLTLVSQEAKRALKRSGFPLSWVDDVCQEAILMLNVAVKKNPSMGYDRTRGNLNPFLRIIIYRFCLRSLSQFTRPFNESFSQELSSSSEQMQGIVEDRIDLESAISRLDSSHKETIESVLAGRTIAETALQANCSPRTVYRNYTKAIELLRRRLS